MTTGYKLQQIEQKLEPVIAQTIEHFNDVKDSELVVSNSIPILFFGDLEAYLNSPMKIVTVALNPSDKEFSETRFVTSEDVLTNTKSYASTLSSYFSFNPYTRWFNNFEKLLHHLKASYYPENNRPSFPNDPKTPMSNAVLHTDICSPIATAKTWSKLKSKTEKEFREKLQANGKVIWSELISVLRPDIILVSGGLGMCDYFDVSWCDVKLPDEFDKSHKMRSATYNGSKLFWFSGKNTPLSFQDIQLGVLAEYVLGKGKEALEVPSKKTPFILSFFVVALIFTLLLIVFSSLF